MPAGVSLRSGRAARRRGALPLEPNGQWEPGVDVFGGGRSHVVRGVPARLGPPPLRELLRGGHEVLQPKSLCLLVVDPAVRTAEDQEGEAQGAGGGAGLCLVACGAKSGQVGSGGGDETGGGCGPPVVVLGGGSRGPTGSSTCSRGRSLGVCLLTCRPDVGRAGAGEDTLCRRRALDGRCVDVDADVGVGL